MINFLSSDSFIKRYSANTRKPDLWFSFYLGIRRLFQPEIYTKAYISRLHFAISADVGPLPKEQRPIGSVRYPPIEVVVVSAEKDFDILPTVIRAALENSLNPIGKITVIVPDVCIRDIPLLLEEFNSVTKLEVISEETLASHEIRTNIRDVAGHRYGWILQQLLKIQFVSNSVSAAVLVIDADTVLTRKRLWIDENHIQLLFSSYEYHEPYYSFLRSISGWPIEQNTSFTTHHMLMQPDILRDILNDISDAGALGWLQKFLTEAKQSDASDFLNDYELYAQGIQILFPNRIQFEKWGNISCGNRHLALDSDYLSSHRDLYSSISFHSYLLS